MSLKSSRIHHMLTAPVLAPVMITAGGVAVVVAALTWIVHRAPADDDRLGTISTQWISEHRSREREHRDR